MLAISSKKKESYNVILRYNCSHFVQRVAKLTLLLHVRKRCVTESFRMRLNAAFVDPMTLHWYAEDFITENSSLDRLKNG